MPMDVINKILTSLEELGWSFFDGVDPLENLKNTIPHTFFIHKKHSESGIHGVGIHIIFSPSNPKKLRISRCLIMNPIDSNVVISLPKHLSKELVLTKNFKEQLRDFLIDYLLDTKDFDDYLNELKQVKLNVNEVEELGKTLLRARFFSNEIYHTIQTEKCSGTQVFQPRKLSAARDGSRDLYELLINASFNLLNKVNPIALNIVVKENGEIIEKEVDSILKSPSRRRHLIKNIHSITDDFVASKRSASIGFKEFYF